MSLPHVRLAEAEREVMTLAQQATELLAQGEVGEAAVVAQLAIASGLSSILTEVAEIRKALGR